MEKKEEKNREEQKNALYSILVTFKTIFYWHQTSHLTKSHFGVSSDPKEMKNCMKIKIWTRMDKIVTMDKNKKNWINE